VSQWNAAIGQALVESVDAIYGTERWALYANDELRSALREVSTAHWANNRSSRKPTWCGLVSAVASCGRGSGLPSATGDVRVEYVIASSTVDASYLHFRHQDRQKVVLCLEGLFCDGNACAAIVSSLRIRGVEESPSRRFLLLSLHGSPESSGYLDSPGLQRIAEALIEATQEQRKGHDTGPMADHPLVVGATSELPDYPFIYIPFKQALRVMGVILVEGETSVEEAIANCHFRRP
jgi:hypothetical protein